MNTIISFLIEVAITLLACLLLVGYLRPYLRRILIDLCGTEDRAQFWTVFSTILLVGLPLIIALSYRPEAVTSQDVFFEIVGRSSGNLVGFLAALIVIGAIVSFFALVAPKPTQTESK
jgi:tellurite resistance protein TehA-like permease